MTPAQAAWLRDRREGKRTWRYGRVGRRCFENGWVQWFLEEPHPNWHVLRITDTGLAALAEHEEKAK